MIVLMGKGTNGRAGDVTAPTLPGTIDMITPIRQTIVLTQRNMIEDTIVQLPNDREDMTAQIHLSDTNIAAQ